MYSRVVECRVGEARRVHWCSSLVGKSVSVSGSSGGSDVMCDVTGENVLNHLRVLCPLKCQKQIITFFIIFSLKMVSTDLIILRFVMKIKNWKDDYHFSMLGKSVSGSGGIVSEC